MSALGDTRFRLAAAAFLLLLATFLVPELRVSRPVYDAIVVMDITTSMTVRDVTLNGAPASRLALEKRAAAALLAALPCGSRLGLAIFVERVPFLLFSPIEVCENYAPLEAEIAALDWRMGWDSESHIAIGVHAAMQMAREEAADLVFMTDGQEMPPLWWTGPPDFHDVAGRVPGVLAGVGGEKLSPVPKYDTYGREIGTWKPGELPSDRPGTFSGHEHLSAVDLPHLRWIAGETGLRLVHLTSEGALFPALRELGHRRTEPTTADLRFPLAGVAFGLLCLSAVPSATRGSAPGPGWGRGPQTPILFRARRTR